MGGTAGRILEVMAKPRSALIGAYLGYRESEAQTCATTCRRQRSDAEAPALPARGPVGA